VEKKAFEEHPWSWTTKFYQVNGEQVKVQIKHPTAISLDDFEIELLDANGEPFEAKKFDLNKIFGIKK
jgi:hypothetical protein